MEINGKIINKKMHSEVLFANDCDFTQPVMGVKRLYITNCKNAQTQLDEGATDEIYINNCVFTKLPDAGVIKLVECKLNENISANVITIMRCTGQIAIGYARTINIVDCENLLVAVGTCNKLQVSGDTKLMFCNCDIIHMNNTKINNRLKCKQLFIDNCTVMGDIVANEATITNSVFNADIKASYIVINNCNYNKRTCGDYVKISNCKNFDSEVIATSVELINCEAFANKIQARSISIINSNDLKIQVSNIIK